MHTATVFGIVGRARGWAVVVTVRPISMSMRSIYTRAVHRGLAGYFGNWEPTALVALGDYGLRVGGNRFERLGSLTSIGVTWSEQASSTGEAHIKFTSSKSVTLTARAGGKAKAAKAGLDVKFGSANAAFFDLAGCTYHRIDNKAALGENLRGAAGFERDWVVVTDLIRARRSIIAISSRANASVAFEAMADVAEIDLGNADLALKASQQEDIGYLVDSQRDLTPILGLCGFKSRFLSSRSALRALSQGERAQGSVPDGVSEAVFLQLY